MEPGQVFTVGLLGVSCAFTAVLVGMTLYDRILWKIDHVRRETESQGRVTESQGRVTEQLREETRQLRAETRQLRWDSERLRRETERLRREAKEQRQEVLRLTRESGRASPVYALLSAYESREGNRLSKYHTVP